MSTDKLVAEIYNILRVSEHKDEYFEGTAERIITLCTSELVEALETSNCPRPVHDNKTVKHCIQSGSCGCDNINVIKGITNDS